jgi:hypothetical protein
MRKGRSATLVAGLAALALVAAACSPGTASGSPASAKDQEIASLKAQIAGLQQDQTYWKQLTSLVQPVSMKTMTDHRAHMTQSGYVIALHFDDMDLGKAKNLNWLAFGVPGRFCAADQQKIEAQFGKGFTHFHDMKNDTHGGKPGAEGVWFQHTAVREFEAPWGKVTPGVDMKFMPTPPPAC